MKMNDSETAIRKYPAARPSSLDPPAATRRVTRGHVQVVDRQLKLRQHRALRGSGHEVGGQGHLPLPVEALNARRPGGRQHADEFSERDRPAPGRKHGQPFQSVEAGAERFARPQASRRTDPPRRRTSRRSARRSCVERLRDVLHAHAEIRRALPIDLDAEFRLANHQRRVRVGELRKAFHLAQQASPSTRRASPRSGPEIEYWMPPPPPPPAAATLVRRFPGILPQQCARPHNHVVLRRGRAHRVATSLT